MTRPRGIPLMGGWTTEMMMRLHVLLAMVLGSLTLMPAEVRAQVHVCGSGPGPNEVQVGEAPGGGGAPTPLCNWTQASVPLVEFWGALAIDSRMHVSGSWNFPSADGAKNSAYDACLQSNSGGCRIINNQAFQRCMAVAADGAGRIFGVADQTCHGTVGSTMEWCKSQSKVGQCHMLAGVVRAGTSRRGFDAENRQQLSLSPDELAALSSER